MRNLLESAIVYNPLLALQNTLTAFTRALTIADLPRTLTLLEQRLGQVQQQQDSVSESRCLYYLAAAHMQLGNERRAISYLQQALPLIQHNKECIGEADSLFGLGKCYNLLGDVRTALQHYAQSLTIFRNLAMEYEEGIVLTALGDVYVALADTHRAWDCYTNSRMVFSKLGNQQAEAAVCWNMGEMLVGQQEYAEAAKLMQHLVDYEDKHGDQNALHHAQMLQQIQARATASNT